MKSFYLLVMYTLCTLSKMVRLVYFFLKYGEWKSAWGSNFNLKCSPVPICTSDARAMDLYYQIERILAGTMDVCATIKTF